MVGSVYGGYYPHAHRCSKPPPLVCDDAQMHDTSTDTDTDTCVHIYIYIYIYIAYPSTLSSVSSLRAYVRMASENWEPPDIQGSNHCVFVLCVGSWCECE
jgi:hypothetical protein